MIEWFSREMPVAETELQYDSPYQLLVAVILSAQCTDKRVNMITPALFEAYPTPEALAVASQEDIFRYIKSCSYPNNKARSLSGMARKLVEDFGGEVPSDMDSLLSLPGVGRKTANVILAVIFNRAAMAVDTHVFRVSNRLGIARGNTPEQVERGLMAAIPEENWSDAHHWILFHGRYVCRSRKPECARCTLAPYCEYEKKTF